MRSVFLVHLVGEPKKRERMKMFELSKFHICANKCFKTTLSIAFDVVNYSLWRLFFKTKKLSHIKIVNEMTGKDAGLFLEVRIVLCWKFDYVMRERLTEKVKNFQGLVFHDFEEEIFCEFRFLFHLIDFCMFVASDHWTWFNKTSTFGTENYIINS